MSKLEKVRGQAAEIQKATRDQTLAYLTAALGLVAGLAWNDAITSAINAVFPLIRDTIIVKFIYAIIITVVVVSLTLLLKRLLASAPPEQKP